MGLTLSQYERGLAITAGQMGFWRTELALGNIDEGKEWRQELALFKFMVHRPMPEPPETMEWLMAFQGPLERAVRDMRAMRASGEFDDFWSDPVAMLRAGGQGELADRYVATFPQEEIEWLGHAHEELELDLSGARTDPERQMIERTDPPLTDEEVRQNWARKEFMTFHGLLMRMHTVFRNAILFYPHTSEIHKKAVRLAMKTAYRFTQYHIDEWEMSLAARIDEIDVHEPGSTRPIKARYRLRKAQRVKLLCMELRACAYARPFRERASFPPMSVPGARDAVLAARSVLGLSSRGALEFVTLDEVLAKADAYAYGYADPWSKLSRDVALCFEAARQWFASAEASRPGGWRHPASVQAGGAFSPRAFAELAALSQAIFVEGWIVDDDNRHAQPGLVGLPTQLGRLALLRRLDDYGVRPELPAAPPGRELVADRAELDVVQPNGMKILRLFELLDQKDRDRFGAWAADQVRRGRLPGEVTRDSETLVLDPQVFGWRQIRQAFELLGISIAVELAERSRPDGRTETVWAPRDLERPIPPVIMGAGSEPTAEDRALNLMEWHDRAFRILALAWVDQEERRLATDANRKRRLDSARERGQWETATKRVVPSSRDRKPGFDRRPLSNADR